MADSKSSSSAPARRSEPALPPGPPNFSDVEGSGVSGSSTHHPGASTVPGAGANPTPLPADEPADDPDATTPASSNVPGAGPNPSASNPSRKS